MKRISICSSLIVCMGLLAWWGASISTAQNIIRDMRAKDISQTPALGRGFSLSTNTYQSLCMQDVKLTEPSYDFDYSFKQLDLAGDYQPGATSADADFAWFVAEKMNDGGFSLQSKGRELTAEEKAELAKQQKDADSMRVINKISTFMGVKINVKTYYASVDESRTKLSKDAEKLLKRNDVPGFFQACGTYYVRGINRESKYEAVFESESNIPKGADAARIQQIKNAAANSIRNGAMGMDQSRQDFEQRYTCGTGEKDYRVKITVGGFPLCFSNPRYTNDYVKEAKDFNCRELEKQCFDEGGRLASVDQVSAWLDRGYGGPAAFAITSTYNDAEQHYIISNDGRPQWVTPNRCEEKNRYFVCVSRAKRDTTFKKKSSIASSKVTIRFKGTGLTHDKNANLVAFSLDEFKNAIKQAYTMMQNPLAGRVQSTEIVPWTENLGVQKLLKMQTEDFISGKEVPLFRKKDILTANGEYLAEMHRALKMRQGRYYLARNCQSQLEATNIADWMVLKNHVEAGLPGKTVGTMKGFFGSGSDGITDTLWDDYMQYLDDYEVCAEKILLGDSNKLGMLTDFRTNRAETIATGKTQRLRDLEKGKAIYLWRWSEYDECKKLSMASKAPENWVWVESCCMPEIWGAPSKMEKNPVFKEFVEDPEYQNALKQDPGSRTYEPPGGNR